MSKKKVITGYIGKSCYINRIDDLFILAEEVRKYKDRIDAWDINDWPPHKVKITIEKIGG